MWEPASIRREIRDMDEDGYYYGDIGTSIIIIPD